MAPDFLEQLADFDVPPPPSEFGQQLHAADEPGSGDRAIDRTADRGVSRRRCSSWRGRYRGWCDSALAANTN